MSPSRSTRQVLGLEAGPERGAPGDVHGRALAVSARRSTRTPSLSSLNDPGADHEVGVEAVGPHVTALTTSTAPCSSGLSSVPAAPSSTLRSPRQLVDRRAQQRLQQLEIQVAADLAGELPRVAVEPAVRAQVAAVGGRSTSSRSTLCPAHGDVMAWRRPRARAGGGASPSAPSTERAIDSASSCSNRSTASGCPGAMSMATRPVAMPRPSPSAANSGARVSSAMRLERQRAVHRRAGRRQRHRGVDVKAIEEVADESRRPRPCPCRPRPRHRDRRQGQVRVAEPDAARADPAERDVARQHRALGRAGDVQLGAGGAGQRHVGAEPGQRRHRLERQLVEHHLDVQLLVIQRRRCRPRPARRHRRAPGAGA